MKRRGGFACPRRCESALGMDHKGDSPDHWRREHPYRTCSYCGSAHPEDFLAAARRGVKIGPTDKSYKAYLGEDGRSKFYFQHLSVAQCDEFVELLNAKAMNIGYPGRFYVLPFFVVLATPKGEGG